MTIEYRLRELELGYEELEDRLAELERRGQQQTIKPIHRPAPPPARPRPAVAPSPAPEPRRRAGSTFEALLGGRVLALLGSFAIVLAGAFFFALAVSN